MPIELVQEHYVYVFSLQVVIAAILIPSSTMFLDRTSRDTIKPFKSRSGVQHEILTVRKICS